MELFIDTETTGTILWKSPLSDPRQPDIIQIAALLCDGEDIVDQLVTLVDPTDINPDWVMSPEAEAVHGFSRERILGEGLSARAAYAKVLGMMERTDTLVCHNVQFDARMMSVAFQRMGLFDDSLRVMNRHSYCTMQKSTNLCRLPGPYGFKWPRLVELHRHLFGGEFEGAHDALSDIEATRKCYYELKRIGL